MGILKNLMGSNNRSFRVGTEWEKDVKEVIFPGNRYDLLYETPSFDANRERYIESSLNPDFKFRDKKTKREFWVECKFRTTLLDGKLQWSNPKQFDRYKDVNKREPVFVCIAFDYPENFEELYYLVPLEKIKYPGLYPSILHDFEIGFSPMVSNILWKL